MLGIPCFAVCVALYALYTAEILSSLLLYVPVVASNHRAVCSMHAALATASSLEALLALMATDSNTAIKSALLAITFAKEACVAGCTRRSSTHMGIMDSTSSFADDVVAAVRGRATRYRLGSNCMLAAAAIVVHAAMTHESPLAHSPLTRALARVQNARTSACVAFLASLGAEDVSVVSGRKKSL